MANYKLILSFGISLFCNLISVTSSAEFPTVTTSKGVLKGKFLRSRDGREYEAYIGIRYGIVPERFEMSVPSLGWEGTKDATEFGSQCPQPSLMSGPNIGDEDCLFLNVYTPKADDSRRPVFIFIHGGGFTYGAGDGYGGKYFMDEEVVLITVNYRLGVLGFLDIRDGVTGNLGLKDLVTALKWVQENINKFGGDASRITVSGESAGGAAVVHLLLSPLAKGLFHQVVSHSGISINPWAFTHDTIKNAKILAKNLECDSASLPEILACLKNKPLSDMLTVQATAFLHFHVDPIVAFPPTLEKSMISSNELNSKQFLPSPPTQLIKTGQFNRIPVLMLVNREEGALLHAGTLVSNPALLKEFSDDWDTISPVSVLWHGYNPRYPNNRKEVTDKIKKFYFGYNDGDITVDKFENLTNLFSDAWFLHGIHETALGLAEHTRVYAGLFTHRRKDWSIINSFGIHKYFDVTAHGDELSYLYNHASEGKAWTLVSKSDVAEKADVEFSKALVKTYVSFAATGIPKLYVEKSSEWAPVSEEERESGHINFQNLGLENYIHVKTFEKRMIFWDNLYKINKKMDKEKSCIA